MKKNNVFFICIILLITLLTACNSGSPKGQNSDYTYGTLENETISSIYELEGEPTQNMVELPAQVSKGLKKSSFLINVCKTTSGGVVAYGEGMYVYSPDKNDENSVINSLVSECVKNQKK